MWSLAPSAGASGAGLVQLPATDARPYLAASPRSRAEERAAALSPGAGSPGRRPPRPARPRLGPSHPTAPPIPPWRPRGPGAHLVFLTDIDEGRDAHGEGRGAADAPLANHASRKRELTRSVAPHNRFRVTSRGP